MQASESKILNNSKDVYSCEVMYSFYQAFSKIVNTQTELCSEAAIITKVCRRKLMNGSDNDVDMTRNYLSRGCRGDIRQQKEGF